MSRANPFLKFDRSLRGGAEDLVCINSSAGNQYMGRTACVSDTLGPSCTISTGVVASDSLIFFNIQNNFAVQSNASPPYFQVATISHGGFFRVAGNSATNVGSFTLIWEVKNPT